MRRREFVITPQLDADGIAAAQQLVGAGNLTMNGALVQTDLPVDRTPVALVMPAGSVGGGKVTITSAGNLSAVTFTVTGKDENGRTITEAVTGPNATTVESAAYFSEVSAVSADGAVGTDVTVGVIGKSVSPVYVPNFVSEDFKCSMVAEIGTTATVTVNHTLDDPWAGTAFRDMLWLDHDDMAAVTVTSDGNYDFSVTGIQLVCTEWTSGKVALKINVPD